MIPLGGWVYVRTPLALTSMERVRHSNRISRGDLFTPHLSLLPCHAAPLPVSLPLAPLALGGTQEPLGPPGKVTAASAHMF